MGSPPEKAPAILDAVKEPFVFAIRNTATYEHVYYGRDGKLRRAYLRSVVHGTGFAYRIVNAETQLVTNEHVASQPDVTDDEHPVEGVPPGSKKVREQLKIVRDETDDYEPGHIALTKVLSDPQADIAVLKARKQLAVMPYRIGRSSALRPGNLVQVRGFPLGAFAALNTGKVLNPMTHDSERGWNHSDFMIDALLSSGNSGSPVFAVSCRTSRAGAGRHLSRRVYRRRGAERGGRVDQLREELETLKVPKRDPAALNDITAQDRDRLVKQLFSETTRSLTFPFGGRLGHRHAGRSADPALLHPRRRLSALDARDDGAGRPRPQRLRHARRHRGPRRRTAHGGARRRRWKARCASTSIGSTNRSGGR